MSGKYFTKGNNKWEIYIIEFLSVFLAVVLAFILNSWRSDQKDEVTRDKILLEISQGLEKDLEDMQGNMNAHKSAIRSCAFWRDVIFERPYQQDKVQMHLRNMFSDYFVLENKSGYETLKSKGLQIIDDDELRNRVINVYEYDFVSLKVLEEEYSENQYLENYFRPFLDIMSSFLQYSEEDGSLEGIKGPVTLSDEEKNKLLTYIFKIESNRKFALSIYRSRIKNIRSLNKEIKAYLGKISD